MGRPREFNLETVLDRVTKVFWTYGYEGTSFSQLERATGLKKASLFAAYGDKRKLFLLALNRYQEKHSQQMEGVCCQELPAREVLTYWLTNIACNAGTKSGCKGCFILNTLVETASHDRKCEKIIIDYRNKIETKLQQLLKRGIKTGEFRSDLVLKDTAQFLFCVASGLQAAARMQPSRKDSSSKAQKGTVALVAIAINALIP